MNHYSKRYDCDLPTKLKGLRYFTAPNNWRRIAHLISDAIYKRLTGEDGYFDTRIVYIAESGSATNRVKRLAIMDQDGQNEVQEKNEFQIGSEAFNKFYWAQFS